METNTIAIAYVPVLHKGYFSYFQSLESEGVEELYLVSDDILASHEELDYIHRKDRIRSVPHEVMLRLVSEVTHIKVFSLTTSVIKELTKQKVRIFAPREDINEFIIGTYFRGFEAIYHSVFLRINKSNLGEEVEPKGGKISLSDFEKTILKKVENESLKSADWWRQVGAALLQGEKVLGIAHNEHMPEEEYPNIVGDARSLFTKGVHINYVTSAHAEASVIADSAREGKVTEGATLFTTDFPCPYCARLIAKAGIKKIYYTRGYAVLGGDDFFKEMGIEINKVDLES